jgi:hypothetical protein
MQPLWREYSNLDSRDPSSVTRVVAEALLGSTWLDFGSTAAQLMEHESKTSARSTRNSSMSVHMRAIVLAPFPAAFF